ncbi:hypothetical protein ATANTOWER_018579 [Ataeniobius toweri]|uniref:PX domain-containing protein n=1 Tax=Ataeniobius toweri TaxID=208326 RepID=A0ABU7C6E0_9TELE|nr:hypothetical protein [Ataeniobius toweri]
MRFIVMGQMLIEGACLLRRMEICVAEAEKRSGKNAVSMQETFTVYLVETRPMDAIAEGRNPPPDSLWRRYSEFELLRNYLIVTYPYIVVPPLPEKRRFLNSPQNRTCHLYQHVELALMLLPQQRAAEEIALSSTDL